MWTFIIFGAVLVGVAVVLMWLTNPDPATRDSDEKSTEQRAFFTHQLRRRSRLNWLIAVVGLAVILSPVVTLPVMRAIYWAIVALVVLWIVFLALLDLTATYFFLQSVRTRQRATRMAMESRYAQLREKIRQTQASAEKERPQQADEHESAD